MRSANFLFKTDHPQIQIIQGRAKLILTSGGSTPHPLALARRSIEKGDYVYVGKSGNGQLYRHVADL